jgi:2-oxoisovalerate dehydrogenase E1 component
VKVKRQSIEIQEPSHTFTIQHLTTKALIDAISEGLKQSMQHHPNLVLMGQDIAEYGGALK